MFCKFTDSINVSNGVCAKRLRRTTRIGARALLSIGVCFGLANEAFAQAVADVAVAIQGPADAPAGQQVEYNVSIGNAGPAAADGAPFSIIFNPPLNNASATCNSPDGAACPPLNGAGPYAGAIPVFPANSGFLVRITGTAPGGTVNATVRVDPPPGTTDPNNGNNEATLATLPVMLQHFDVQ